MACGSSGTAHGEAGKGFALLEVAVPSLLTITVQDEEEPMGVIIGMDPPKRSATIEVVDERGRRCRLDASALTKPATPTCSPRAGGSPSGCGRSRAANGIGRHIAHRPVHDGETVLDVPGKLTAQVRVFATGNGRKTDPVDAHSVAMVALRTPGWSAFGSMPIWW